MSLKPMLASPADLQELDGFIADDSVWLERKVDGQRVMIHVTQVLGETVIEVRNRAGEPKVSVIPKQALAGFRYFDSGTWTFDGELVGKVVNLFDLVESGETVTMRTPLEQRRTALEMVVNHWQPDANLIQLVERAESARAKQMLISAVRQDQGEGVMVKRRDSRYVGGRSTAWRKVKFERDIDVIITELGIDGKDNAAIAVLDPINNRIYPPPGAEPWTVSTIGKRPTPAVGQVWTVRYLGIYDPDNDPKLYQPRLKVYRPDKPYHECTIDQLEGAWLQRTPNVRPRSER